MVPSPSSHQLYRLHPHPLRSCWAGDTFLDIEIRAQHLNRGAGREELPPIVVPRGVALIDKEAIGSDDPTNLPQQGLAYEIDHQGKIESIYVKRQLR